MAKVSGVCAEDQKRTVRSDGAVLFVAMVIPLCVCVKYTEVHAKANFVPRHLKCFNMKN